jgi:hypothetical protein
MDARVGGRVFDVGFRAGTRRTPQGYMLQTYYKGALVLHMLRVLLREQSGGDDLFVEILRDFLKTHECFIVTLKLPLKMSSSIPTGAFSLR